MTPTSTTAVGHLRFEHVDFHYPDSDELILQDVNLDVAPGETIAIVGATGSGKTSLTALVPRLYDATAGRVTIDGVDTRDLTLPSLRRIVATAFEDATLFSMSARENVTLGRPDASDDDIRDAIETAQAAFVYELPWGLETRIGEQGMSLSGGQRQRLALARAVLAQPKVLVLDDTLSALDVHTEALVERALRRVLVGDDRDRGRPPSVDGHAGGPGGTAVRAARSPTSASTTTCWRPCRPTASCSRPTPTPRTISTPIGRGWCCDDRDPEHTPTRQAAGEGLARSRGRARRRDLGAGVAAAEGPLPPAARIAAAAVPHRPHLGHGRRADRERGTALGAVPGRRRASTSASRRSRPATVPAS